MITAINSMAQLLDAGIPEPAKLINM